MVDYRVYPHTTTASNAAKLLPSITVPRHPSDAISELSEACSCPGTTGRSVPAHTYFQRTVRFVRILIAPAAVFGTSFAFALQMLLLTPFLTELGISKSAVSLVWLVGPLAGLIVQPLVGYLSDEYHKVHATRLPIVLVGSVVLVLSHGMIACTRLVAYVSTTPPLVVVITGFLLLDSANNAILVTTRAMLSDRFGKEHRTFAFSVLQFWTSLGFVVGNLTVTTEASRFGSGDNSAALHSSPMEKRIFYCFAISALTVIVSTFLSFLSVHEKRACRARFHGPHVGETFCVNNLFINPALVSVAVGSLLTWFGWFAQQIYQTDYISKEVLMKEVSGGGNNFGPTDEGGIYVSALGLLINSILSCLFGLVLPVLLSYIGYDSFTLFRVWSVSTFFQSIVLFMSPLVSTSTGSIVWEASGGPLFAIACTVPYMLVANNCDHGCAGRVMAFVNLAVCAPQLVVSLVGGVLVKVANTDIVLFMIGGLLCVVAAKLLWVPPGSLSPPWSEASAASLIASTSELFASPGPEPKNWIEQEKSPEFQLRGLSSPKLFDRDIRQQSLSYPLLLNSNTNV